MMLETKQTPEKKRTRRLRRGESGNAMLEMALTIGPLFVLLFGTVDLGVWACWRLALNSATQEAVRNVITHRPIYNGVTYSSMTAMVNALMIDRSLGFITSGNVSQRVMVRYFLATDMINPLLQSNLPVSVGASGGLPPRVVTNLNQFGNIVQVDVVSVPWNWMISFSKVPGYETSLSHASMNISLTAADVLPNLPVGVFAYPNP